MDELLRHLGGALRLIVERRDGGEDGRSCFGGQLHVAKMDAIERSFAHAENERTAFFEADIGGAMDEVAGETVGDRSERSHGARKDDHGAGGVASAGDGGADVGVAVLAELVAGSAEKLFCKIVAPA